MKTREAKITWHQGRSVRAALRGERYTQTDLASEAGLSRAFASLWLDGRSGSDRLAAALAKILPEWTRTHLPELWHSVNALSSEDSQPGEDAGQVGS